MIPWDDGIAVVLGMGPSGLFVARQIARMRRPVAGIARPDDLGRYSRSLALGGCTVATSRQEVLDALGFYKERFGTVYAIPSSDQYLTLLLQEPLQTLEGFGIAAKEVRNFRLINDKNALMQTLDKNIKIPLCCSLLNCRNGNFSYPCIVKWKEKELGRQSTVVPKAIIVNGRAEAESVLAGVLAEGFSGDSFILQELVRGDNSRQYSVGGYYKNGRLLAGMVVNQTEQYPQGISACVVESNDEIAEDAKTTSLQFAKKIMFSGFLEMEYKAEEKTGELFLLDVNPRPWGWVSILGAKYPEFNKVFFGLAPRPAKEKIRWKSPLRVPLCSRNQLNVKVASFVGKTVYDIVDAKDIGPLLALPLVAARKVICV